MTTEDHTRNANTAATAGDGALLRLEDVHKRFGRLEVLRGVNLQVPRGTVTCVIGPSGSGKSTLLRCVNLLEPPNRGRIIFEGEEITTAKGNDIDRVRRRLGMVFQSFNLFPHKTALENVTMAPAKVLGRDPEECRAKGEALLARVGLADKLDEYPDRLSGGQQQRVAIARALVSDPVLLVCDEPTGDLDRETSDSILELLQLLNREHGKTIVMVTHDPKAAGYASRRLYVDKGVLVDRTMGAAA